MKFFFNQFRRQKPGFIFSPFPLSSGFLSVILLTNHAQAETHDLLSLFKAGQMTDPTLNTSRAQLAADQLTADIALGKLLPQINARLEVTSTDDETGNSGSRSGEIILQQSLFDPVAWYDYRAAYAESAAAKTAFSDTQQQWLLTLIRTYADTLRAIAAQEAANTDTLAFTEALHHASQRHTAGLVVKTEVLEAQAALDNAYAAAHSAKAELSLQLEILSRISSQPVTAVTPFTPGLELQLPDEQQLNQWLLSDGINHPQIQQAQQEEIKMRLLNKSAAAAHLPKADFTATVQHTQGYGNKHDEGTTTMLSAKITLPLLAGGSHYGEQQKTHWQAIAAGHQQEESRRAVRFELRRLLRQIRYDVMNINGRRQAIISATSAMNATRSAHRIGTRNMVDVLNAQRTLSAAEKEFANARSDYMTHLMELKYYAGALDETDVALMNRWFSADEN